ncbi:Eukaryotic translation initiation factor 1b [Coemansia sp. RSA 2599]|nr:Eukaryotic translation initiation factor 1b [Coemansia sp. RSA 2598]KAJ1828825.1 Eukaryotic translation initiation factor 1b [Coemansia sp. RSA 2599]
MTEKSASKDATLDSALSDNDNERSEVTPATEGFSDSEDEKTAKKSSKKKKQKKRVVEDSFDDIDDEEALLNSRPAGVSFDPFESEAADKKVSEKIHIRVQTVKGKKTVTTMAGLDPKFDLKKMTKFFKATYGCNGKVVSDEEHGEIIQLSGDQRSKVKQFLLDEKIATNSDISMHGF